MELGAKLGEGGGSEAYAWGDDQVVKLFKPNIDRRVIDYEMQVTRTVFEAGAPAPEVRGVTEVNGRTGIIFFPRYDGETLLNAIMGGRISPSAAGEIMAQLVHSLHTPGYRASVVTFRQWALLYLRQLRSKNVDRDVLDTVHRTLLTLPEGGVLCHGDLHADNILMTGNGPVAIDWISALSANPLVDVARQHVTLTLIIDRRASGDVAVAENLDRGRHRAGAAFIETYAGLAGMTTERLLAALAPYMVVMAAMRIMESNCTDEEHDGLVRYIKSMAS